MPSHDQICRDIIRERRVCILIPTYNNAGTLSQVLEGCLFYSENIIVVNDGSTDSTDTILKRFDNITVFHHAVNQGKGMAIKTGFDAAMAAGYQYVVTIDSDGQHLPADLPYLINGLYNHPDSIIIGSRNMNRAGIPGKSSFGNKFSNFWFRFDTGIDLPDTQSGYRIYPLESLKGIRLLTWKFEFEVEILVKSAWRNIPIIPVPVRVYYPPGDIRVSHFRPFRDFTRISILNTIFFIQALLFYIPLRWWRQLSNVGFRKSLMLALHNPLESVSRRSAAIGFGVFMGIFPVWGYQLIIGWALCHYFRLNKLLFTVAAHISIPPMIPIIIYLSYLAGRLVTGGGDLISIPEGGITLESVANNLFQYLVGAVLLSIFAGILAFYVSLLMYKVAAGKSQKN